MIKIDTAGPSGADYEAWRRRAVKRRDKDIKKWIADGKPCPGPEPSQRLWKDFKELFLDKVFYSKCAYCEANHSAGFPAHVEHYRPKLLVTEARNAINHPGYFWLAYEWENLLLSCNNCNTLHSFVRDGQKVSRPGKWNEFKIKKQRVAEPSADPDKWSEELKAEEPLLLNPYFDNPSEHIYFLEGKEHFGMFYHLTREGEETIEACDLNRLPLVEARKKITGRAMRRVERALKYLELILEEDDPELELKKNETLEAEVKKRIEELLQFGSSTEFSAWLNVYARREYERRVDRMTRE